MNWLMSILSLLGAASTIFAPQIQGAVSSHPAIFGTIAGIFGVIAHILPSPTGAAVVTATGETGKATAVK